MPTAPFEKTTPSWQFQQSTQRLAEWIELKLREFKAPNWTPPDWQFPDFSISSRVWEVLFWLIVIAFALWLGARLYPVWKIYWAAIQGKLNAAAQQPQPVLERPVSEWLQQAQKLQQQGNYPEACRALYMAMLQQLNDRQVAPHEPSRTDGEYLNLVQRLAAPRAYQTLIATHEQFCFGGTELSSEDFQRCQQAYRDIADNSHG